MGTTVSQRLIPLDAIDRAAQVLLEAAPAGSEVILFGSYARGTAAGHSDVDFLVVEPLLDEQRGGQHGEMVRLRDALRDLQLPVDVLVTSREIYES